MSGWRAQGTTTSEPRLSATIRPGAGHRSRVAGSASRERNTATQKKSAKCIFDDVFVGRALILYMEV